MQRREVDFEATGDLLDGLGRHRLQLCALRGNATALRSTPSCYDGNSSIVSLRPQLPCRPSSDSQERCGRMAAWSTTSSSAYDAADTAPLSRIDKIQLRALSCADPQPRRVMSEPDKTAPGRETAVCRPTVRILLVADVRCYFCGATAGALEQEQGAATRVVLFLTYSEPEARPLRPAQTIRCSRGGPTFVDNVEYIRRRQEVQPPMMWERSRRGRPPKYLGHPQDHLDG